ncbi:TonB-dependent hemoglobin/transferrin/lactoferrin family receptor [Aureimonas psammosilenae]|uniref:TonB-dependent hemoglobin/transferrin/lactoferrin family receptor n=1 Tax=Aureimonas psammosilenae TaxID=2495496 RepID=UPI00186A4E6A|nr:TonB-dependent hemoglobin/transferrin/lactoferrin family receptor [Aureimonas psammosilenae]
MSDRIRHLLFGAAVVALLGGGQALAQSPTARTADDEPGDGVQTEIELETVTVDARARVRNPTAPAGTATTRTTTREAIDNRQINNIQDIGRTEEAGVSFNRTNNSVNIRGLDGSRVLTTVDGVRVPYLSDATRGAVGGVNSFDFNSLSAFDLTRGADPLLGNGALGGVLAIRTLDPDDILKDGRKVGYLTKNGYDGVDDSWFTSHAAATRVGDTSLILQGGYRDGHAIDNQGGGDALSTLRTAPNPRDYDQYNLLGKLYQDVEGGHRFGITGEIFDRNEDINTRTLQTATGNYRRDNHFSGEDLKRRKVALTYDLDAPEPGSGWFDDASAVLYYQDVERHTTVDAFRSTSVIGPFSRDNSYDEESIGFTGYAARDWQLGGVGNRFTFGGEVYGTKTTQYSAGADGCATATRPSDIRACTNLHTNQADTPQVDSRVVGFYAENETRFLDNRLRVTPGLRFDWYEHEPKLTDEYRDSAAFNGTVPDGSNDVALSPKVLVEYDIIPSLTAYGQYTQGFRAPTAGELFGRFGAVGTYLRTGNPDLDPETSSGFDVGLRYGDKDLGAQVNLFTTHYDNFIDTVLVAPPGGNYPQGGITSYRNIPNARISGVELSGHARFLDHWRARASVAYQEGENLTDDVYLDSIPPLTAILALGYDRTTWGGEVSTKLADRRDKVDDGFNAPSYGVVDFTAWVSPERLPNLKLAGGVFNIFDKTYYDAVNVPDDPSRTQPRLYYSEPGRSFKVNMTVQF